MNNEDVYEKLRIVFSTGPGIAMPKTKQANEILKECYTPEEAEIVCYIEALWTGFVTGATTLKTAEEVAKEAGKDPNYVATILEDCYQKGTIGKGTFGGKKGYYHMQASTVEDPPFCDGRTDRSARRMAHLWQAYEENGYLMEFATSSKYALRRVLPIETSVDSEETLYDWEKASTLLRVGKHIANTYCGCRERHFGNCDNPEDTCLSLTMEQSSYVDRGTCLQGRDCTFEEAIDVIKRSNEAALVMTTYNYTYDGKNGDTFICNCCSDCCHILRARTVLGNPRALAPSNFRPVVDEETCNACLDCAKKCPTNALLHHPPHRTDGKDDTVKLVPNLCIGCGVCVQYCKVDAIKLKRISDEKPEESMVGMVKKFNENNIRYEGTRQAKRGI